MTYIYPDSKDHGANMGPHVGPMYLFRPRHCRQMYVNYHSLPQQSTSQNAITL